MLLLILLEQKGRLPPLPKEHIIFLQQPSISLPQRLDLLLAPLQPDPQLQNLPLHIQAPQSLHLCLPDHLSELVPRLVEGVLESIALLG
jgi:hypothetical protein